MGTGPTDFRALRRIQTHPLARGSALTWESCEEIGRPGHRPDGGCTKPSKGHLPVRELGYVIEFDLISGGGQLYGLKIQTEG